MKSIKFVKFNPRSRRLPEIRKLCLVLVPMRKIDVGALPPTIAVGYLIESSSSKDWVVPGVGGPVTHYADCLPADFPPRIMWHEMAMKGSKTSKIPHST